MSGEVAEVPKAAEEVATPEETPKAAEENGKEEKVEESKKTGETAVAEAPKAWVSTLSGGAVRKLAYVVLEWVNGTLGSETPVPGAEKKEVTPTEFVDYFKNGASLCQLANKLQPGAIAEVHSGAETTAEQQKENLDNFKTFAKDNAGVAEADLYKTEKVEKGKGFKGLLSTLIGLGTKAAEKFKTDGLNVNTLLELGVAAFGKNFINNLINRFFKRGASSAVKEKKEKGATAEAETKPVEVAAPEAAQEATPAES